MYIVIIGLALLVSTLLYNKAKLILREKQVEKFFNNKSDLQWAKQFLDKEVDYCTQIWSKSDTDGYISHTGRYSYQQPTGIYDATDFVIFDLQKKQVTMTVPDHDVESGSDFKWVRDDKYIVIFRIAAHDDDFKTPTIDIGNLRTGAIIHLANAKTSPCTAES